jgi:hypothetical protein
MDFDSAEFESFKASAAPAAGGFDPKEFESFKSGKKDAVNKMDIAEPADHGLSERQKLSPTEKALSPITNYPDTYQRMNKESRDQISEGISRIKNHDSLTEPDGHGASDIIIGAVKAAAGTLGYVASPISAAYRSVVGQPVEDVTGIPREYTEFAAQLATPGIGLPGAARSPAPNFPKPAPVAAEGNGLASAAERLAQTGNPVEVPRAIASDNVAVQRAGQGIRNMPIIGDAIPKATARLGTQLEDAAGGIASEYGGGSGQNVAHNIGQTIGSAAERETLGAKAAAQQGDAAVLADWERTHSAANETIAGYEGAALARARQSVGDMSPQDMGETLVARLRQGEQEARATKDRLYGVAEASDGAITAEAVPTLRPRVAASLADAGREIDATLTPAANRLMAEIDRFSRGGNADVTPGAVYPRSMQEIEQTRKRLSNFAQAATNDADRAASRMVVREFDNWLSDSFDNALFSGSDEALNAFRAARAANTEWRQRFGFNARDDADRVINRIVTGEVTPQEVANYVVGASKVGSKGVSSRLLTRIAEATGGDPEAMQAIRGGVWNRLSQATEGATPKAPEKIATDINEFLNGSGRDVAQRLFSEPQQSIMRTYAQALRQGQEARALVADVAANTRPGPAEVGIGPLQKLANDVLGKGGRSDEALYSAINSYAKSGAKGDIHLLSRILQAVPQSDRGNLASAMVRDMGVSPRTGQFSPDVFVSTWGTYKPEAKALLFGMSGPQRVALDDIAMISQRMKEVGSKFGNPSGTAQNANFLGLASAFFAAPLTTIAAGIGGAATAKVLSTPVGAAAVSKWSRAYEVAATRPTEAALSTLQRATALLSVNISRDSGMPVKDIMQRLQGPVPAGAQDEKR